MIVKYNQLDRKKLDTAIQERLFQNVYLYIDTKTYGYENKTDVMTWAVVEDDTIKAVLFKYYNSLQFLKVEEMTEENFKEICDHIRAQHYEMISGDSDSLSVLCTMLENAYKMTTGYILLGDEYKGDKSGITQLADENMCSEIAKLICSDQSIGGHYTTELLTEQLVDRQKNWHCQNIVLLQDGKIVSHMGTYADYDDVAVLGGLVTDTDYRGKGYGGAVLKDLALLVQSENKTPILYCFEEDTTDWYVSQGWRKHIGCAKLELRK